MCSDLRESNRIIGAQQQDHGDSLIQSTRHPLNQPFAQLSHGPIQTESMIAIRTPSDLPDSRFTYYVGRSTYQRGTWTYPRNVATRTVSDAR